MRICLRRIWCGFSVRLTGGEEGKRKKYAVIIGVSVFTGMLSGVIVGMALSARLGRDETKVSNG